MKTLSNLEYIILALVAEKPVHGYQIEQTITERGMREWTDIGFSSIYHVLNKLRNSGALTCQTEAANDRPSRKIYSITSLGEERLHSEVILRLSTPQPYSPDFDLALSSLPVLSREEIRSAVSLFHAQLTAKILEVKEKQASLLPYAEKHVLDLFGHSLNAMQSELDWVSDYLKIME